MSDFPGLPESALPETDEEFVFTDSPSKGSKYFFESGTYPATIVSFQKTMSKNGKPQLIFGLVGTSGKASGIDYKLYMGRKWEESDPGFSPENEQPKDVYKFGKVLDVVGIPKVPAGQSRVFKKSDIIGKSVGLVLKQDTFDGKDRMKADAIVVLPTSLASNDTVPF